MMQTAAINTQRDAFISCLEKARESAKAEKVAGDGFDAYARQSCAPTGEKFKAALIAFDMKNKVARARALADAEVQIDDFISGEASIYKRSAAASAKPASAAPAPTQASSPSK
jgi:hypothetical protein